MKLKVFKEVINDLCSGLTDEEIDKTEICFSLYNENEYEDYKELRIFGEGRDLYDDKAIIYIDFDLVKEESDKPKLTADIMERLFLGQL